MDTAESVYVGSWATVQQITAGGTVIGRGGTGCACPGGWGLNVAPAVDALTNVYAATEGGLWVIPPDGSTAWFAGNVVGGFSDGPRLLALFQGPQALAVDVNTNIVVADISRVRNIRSDGWVSTLAGTGITGYLNGLGSIAQFGNAAGVCSDGHGHIYVSDSANNCIREIMLGPVPTPSLQVRSILSQIVLSWPVWATDFVLESSGTLASVGTWTPLTNGVAAADNYFVLTNTPAAAAAFYRLRHR